jgi:hypothetical protein
MAQPIMAVRFLQAARASRTLATTAKTESSGATVQLQTGNVASGGVFPAGRGVRVVFIIMPSSV